MRSPLVKNILLAFLLSPSFVFADREAGNRIYVTVSENGQFYAKSFPAEQYGLKGKTEVYLAGEKDELLQTYDWYSPQLYLSGWLGTKTVYAAQMGPWQRGNEASHDHLAIAFYKNDRLLGKYTTLDIAGSPKNVSNSVSHYTLFRHVKGFVYPHFHETVYFEVETHDKRTLIFDADTGKRVTPDEKKRVEELGGIRSKIATLKMEWMMKNKALYDADTNKKVTREMIDAVSPGQFPQLPSGYMYVPGAVWDGVELKKL